MYETCLTGFQVAKLSQRPHLQMLQVKSVRLPPSQIPHHMFIDHTHASELHQRTKQQRHLKGISLMHHSVYTDAQTGLRHAVHTQTASRYLCFIDSFDVWGREVGVDLVDVLLVHVLRYTVLIKVVHHVGARQHAVHLKPNSLFKCI